MRGAAFSSGCGPRFARTGSAGAGKCEAQRLRQAPGWAALARCDRGGLPDRSIAVHRFVAPGMTIRRSFSPEKTFPLSCGEIRSRIPARGSDVLFADSWLGRKVPKVGGAKSRGCRGRRSPSGPDSPLLPPLFRSFAVRSCREVPLIPLFERASRDAELPERPTHAGRPHEPARAFVVVGEVRGGFSTGFASRSSSALGAAFRSDRRQGLAPLFRPSTSCVRCGRSTAWSGGRKLSACCRICRAVRRCIRGW